jgi:uncharacterized protein YhfF
MTDDFEAADEILTFWEAARHRAGVVRTSVVTGLGVSGAMVPPTWSFGDNARLADQLLDLVLAGEKTGTSTALVEFDHSDEPMPVRGDLSIVLDSGGHPRALLRTTEVATVPFSEVPVEHAVAEGEDDRTLATWRVEHETYWRRVLAPLGVEFSHDLPVVTERFELLYPRTGDR